MTYPNDSFQTFCKSKIGKFEMDSSFDLLHADCVKDSQKELEKNLQFIRNPALLESLNKQEKTEYEKCIKKIQKMLDKINKIDKINNKFYSLDDFIKSYDSNEDYLSKLMIIEPLMKNPKKQNIGEKYTKRCLDYCTSRMDNVSYKKAGKIWFSQGNVVEHKPKGITGNGTKNIDFIININNSKIFATQKRSGESGGGQDSAFAEIKQYSEESVGYRYCNGIPLCILDGDYYSGQRKQTLFTINHRILIVESCKLLYLCEWLNENKNNISSIFCLEGDKK